MATEFLVTLKTLPTPIKTTSIIYVGCLLGYNIFGTYVDSKIYLKKYRTKSLNYYESKNVNNEWDAVKYGASINALNRLWDSLIWPVTCITNIVPAVVLMLNPPPKSDK